MLALKRLTLFAEACSMLAKGIILLEQLSQEGLQLPSLACTKIQ